MEKSPDMELAASTGAGFSAPRCIPKEAQQKCCRAVVPDIWSKETGQFYRAVVKTTWEIFLSLFPRHSRKLPVEVDCPGHGSPFIPYHSS